MIIKRKHPHISEVIITAIENEFPNIDFPSEVYIGITDNRKS